MITLEQMDNLPETFTFNGAVYTKYYDPVDDLFRPFYANKTLGISASYNPKNNSLTFYDDKNRSKKLYSLAFSATEPQHFVTERKDGSTFYKLADSNFFIHPDTLETIEAAPRPHNNIVTKIVPFSRGK